jgi:hypothetical protein
VKRITDREFVYIRSTDTDVRKTFQRIRAQQEQPNATKSEPNAYPTSTKPSSAFSKGQEMRADIGAFPMKPVGKSSECPSCRFCFWVAFFL